LIAAGRQVLRQSVDLFRHSAAESASQADTPIVFWQG